MKYLFLILFLPICFNSQSQLELYNSSLIDTSQALVILHYNNHLRFKNAVVDSTIILIVDDDTLRNNDHFAYTPKQRGSDTIHVYKEGQKIGESIFVVKVSSPLKVRLGNLKDSIVSKNQLLENRQFNLFYEQEYVLPCSHIMAFRVSIKKEIGRTISFKDRTSLHGMIPGSQLTNKQIKKVKKMQSGDALIVELIQVSCASCISRLLSPNLRYIVN